MPDVADLDQEHIEKHAPYELAVRNSVPPPGDGQCLNCDAQLGPGSQGRFCDADCLHDWEVRQERERVNGGGRL